MTTFCSARKRTAIHSSAFLVLVAVATLGFAASAHAGNYTAKFCAQGVTPDGDKGPFERFGPETIYETTNNCGGFNGLRVSLTKTQQANAGAEGGWLMQRPDGIGVVQIDYKAAAKEKSGGQIPQVIGDADGDTQLDVIAGAGKLQGDFSDLNIVGDARRFGVRLVCSPDSGPTCPADPPGDPDPDIRLKDLTYTLSDPAPPTLTITGGSLSTGEIQTGGQSVAFDAADTGSGVYRAFVLANGQQAGETFGNCALAGNSGLGFKPCGASFAGEVALNTATAPWHGGTNKVKTCVEDYSRAVTCSATTKVRVLNGCSFNAAPVNVGQTLELQWPGKRNAAIQARQGRARDAVATLFGPNGTPLAGAAVCLSRSIPDGRGMERVIEPGAVTGPDGSVAVKVRGASSRSVYATYWVDSETLITNELEMKVAPRIKLGLRPSGKLEKGEKVTVVANLRGKWKGGRKVCFYADRPGNDKIGCGQSAEGGRAKTVYTPKRTGRTYFYAKVPNQKGYPYVNARSAKKHARVVG